MRLGVPRAAGADPRIVAVTPDVARRLGDLGYEVLVEPGPGTARVLTQGIGMRSFIEHGPGKAEFTGR
jgi:NAD/NADP transhydrogenase alpha subunit